MVVPGKKNSMSRLMQKKQRYFCRNKKKSRRPGTKRVVGSVMRDEAGDSDPAGLCVARI